MHTDLFNKKKCHLSYKKRANKTLRVGETQDHSWNLNLSDGRNEIGID